AYRSASAACCCSIRSNSTAVLLATARYTSRPRMANTTQAAPAVASAIRRRNDHGRSPLADTVDAVAASLEVGDEVLPELAAQVVDVDLDRIAGDAVLEAIQLLLDLGARDEASRLAHQQLGNGVLARRERRRLTPARDAALTQIEHHVARG